MSDECGEAKPVVWVHWYSNNPWKDPDKDPCDCCGVVQPIVYRPDICAELGHAYEPMTRARRKPGHCYRCGVSYPDILGRKLPLSCTATTESPWGVLRCTDAPGHAGDHACLTTPGEVWAWRQEPTR